MKYYVLSCPDYERGFTTREAAERAKEGIERLAICEHDHVIEEVAEPPRAR